MDPGPLASLLSFAAAHHGLFRVGDAQRLGWSYGQLHRRVRHGLFEPVGKGVYRVVGVPAPPGQRLLAGVWRTDGVGSHRSAAHQTDLIDRPPARPELTVDRAGAHEFDGLVVHRSGDLHLSTVIDRNGIPVTAPARTLVDLGQVISLARLEDAVHRALHRGIVRLDDLVDEYRTLSRPGRRGAGPMREVLRAIDPTSARLESRLELEILRLIRAAGLPEPVPQYVVVVGGRTYRLDFAYPDHLVFLEGDGFGVHGTRDAFESDRDRQNDLVTAGWRPLRFTWRGVRRRPGSVPAAVAAVLGL